MEYLHCCYTSKPVCANFIWQDIVHQHNHKTFAQFSTSGDLCCKNLCSAVQCQKLGDHFFRNIILSHFSLVSACSLQRCTILQSMVVAFCSGMVYVIIPQVVLFLYLVPQKCWSPFLMLDVPGSIHK